MHVAQKWSRFWEIDMHQSKNACRPETYISLKPFDKPEEQENE